MKHKAKSRNKIRTVREKAGLTQQKLAALCNTTPQQIRHLEAGSRGLTVEWLRRLAKALECHPWSLVEEQADFLSGGDKTLLVKIRSLSAKAQKEVEKFVDWQIAEKNGK